MKTQVLRGKLEPLGLVKVLAFISNLKETGYLKVSREQVEKTLIIKHGEIIFAKSTLPEDRLGDILLSQGRITHQQYEEASQLLTEKGFRHGRSLVEIKAISPKVLWEAIENQIRTIAYSVIPWEEGQFEYVRQPLAVKEKITLRLSILDMVMDVVRHYNHREVFKEKMPDLNAVPVVSEVPSGAIQLEPHERHILNLVDGETNLEKLCEQADFGLEEGLRTIFLLHILGVIELTFQEQDEAKKRQLEMIGHYNEAFVYVHGFLSQQMGHVAHNLLKKYYHDIQTSQEAVFAKVELNQDGSFDPNLLLSNLYKAPVAQEYLDGALQEALEEYLYASMLAIKRALGTKQETLVVKHIEELQNNWA